MRRVAPIAKPIGVVVVFPIAVADHYDRVRILCVVAFRPGEEPPRFGFHAKHVKKVAGNHLAPNFRGVRRLAHGKHIPVSRRHERQQFHVVSEIAEIEEGSGDGLTIRRHVFDGHHAFWLRGAGQGIQQHRAHPAKDRCASPDANADRQDSHCSKARFSRERAKAVANITQHSVHNGSERCKPLTMCMSLKPRTKFGTSFQACVRLWDATSQTGRHLATGNESTKRN